MLGVREEKAQDLQPSFWILLFNYIDLLLYVSTGHHQQCAFWVWAYFR